jgi:type II secretory pathway pseudopilin PulG
LTVRRIAHRRRDDRGVVLLTLLIALTVGAWAFLGAAQVWELERRREQEQELLFIGAQFIDAAQRFYYAAPPGQPRRLPLTLEELLEDNRYPVAVRHLRRIYVDPITGHPDWVFERSGRGLGVHSVSEASTLKRANFPLALTGFAGKQTYREWVFTFVPPLRSEAGLPAPGARAGLSLPAPTPVSRGELGLTGPGATPVSPYPPQARPVAPGARPVLPPKAPSRRTGPRGP